MGIFNYSVMHLVKPERGILGARLIFAWRRNSLVFLERIQLLNEGCGNENTKHEFPNFEEINIITVALALAPYLLID